jgi:NADH dehydrogenase
MTVEELHVVTGAFGYSGRYIARRLLAAGIRVRTLTNSVPRPHLFDRPIEVYPLAFDDPAGLVASLKGAAVLYNTYWVRFNHAGFSLARAVRNTLRLFEAAHAAGVRRIVHISITNPSEDSPLEYFRGKAQLERALRNSGVSWAILRPAVLFGDGDILINNIAWCLRHLPFMPVFGTGLYRLQPIHVDDLAALAVQAGQMQEPCLVHAIGPQTFTFLELLEQLGEILDCPRPLIRVSPELGWWGVRLLGWFLNDVVLTREEIAGLMQGLLAVDDAPPAGSTRLTDWARQHAATLGLHYASELARRSRAASAPPAVTGARA